jgi:hypothetical protein
MNHARNIFYVRSKKFSYSHNIVLNFNFIRSNPSAVLNQLDELARK